MRHRAHRHKRTRNRMKQQTLKKHEIIIITYTTKTWLLVNCFALTCSCSNTGASLGCYQTDISACCTLFLFTLLLWLVVGLHTFCICESVQAFCISLAMTGYHFMGCVDSYKTYFIPSYSLQGGYLSPLNPTVIYSKTKEDSRKI